MHKHPESGLRFFPCEANGCFYAKDAQGTLYVAPMFESGEPDFDSMGEVDPGSEIPVSEIEAFLSTQVPV